MKQLLLYYILFFLQVEEREQRTWLRTRIAPCLTGTRTASPILTFPSSHSVNAIS